MEPTKPSDADPNGYIELIHDEVDYSYPVPTFRLVFSQSKANIADDIANGWPRWTPESLSKTAKEHAIELYEGALNWLKQLPDDAFAHCFIYHIRHSMGIPVPDSLPPCTTEGWCDCPSAHTHTQPSQPGDSVSPESTDQD